MFCIQLVLSLLLQGNLTFKEDGSRISRQRILQYRDGTTTDVATLIEDEFIYVNNETDNSLWHGECCYQKLFSMYKYTDFTWLGQGISNSSSDVELV